MTHRVVQHITLVGDGIENPWNARTMIEAARMFGGACVFRDRAGLSEAWREVLPDAAPFEATTRDALARDHAPIVVCDTLDGAADVCGFALPRDPDHAARPAVVVGNERRGIARDMQTLTQHRVRIPMVSRQITCLNVAAASAVVLYYLSRGGGGTLQHSVQPHRRRPELLLAGATDHVELGSTIRSAAAFGWERLFVEDRAGVWFGVDRATRSEGRAAARRGRNAIRVVPATQEAREGYEEVCVVTTRQDGVPLHRARLAGGARQLIAIPDEEAVDVLAETWARRGKKATLVNLDPPSGSFAYHYRLVATLALAEIARQVGRPASGKIDQPGRRGPSYDSMLGAPDEQPGEAVYLDELEIY